MADKVDSTTTTREGRDAKGRPTRTCVGCGRRDVVSALLRLVVLEGDVAFDLAGGAFGRGAHVHPIPECLGNAPRGLARSLRRAVSVDAAGIGGALVVACDRRTRGLLLSAHRLRMVAVGAEATARALPGALAVLAADAGSVGDSQRHAALGEAVAAGNVMIWATKGELGELLGVEAVSICAVRHPGIAEQLKWTRAARDAGVTAAREGAECSSRFREAR